MANMNKLVLGIETSCDDTSVCLLRGTSDLQNWELPEVLAMKTFNQDEFLGEWGGVVPELAARNHLAKLAPVLESVFKETALEPKDLDLVGVTTHPGLLGPLLTGLNAGKTLSLLYKLPLNPVNHLYAHLEAIHLTEKVSYPYLGLIVSGGHSMFVLAESSTKFELIGTTIDDAAGEAFDKGGKLMGLEYPAGRIIDEKAKNGDPKKYKFPVGLKSSKNCNLSYSGTKTSLRVFLDEHKDFDDWDNLCASYQFAIVEALRLKSTFASKVAKEKYGKDLPLVVGGGVACNSHLRSVMREEHKEVYIVQPKFCTDNGGMIANYALRTMEEKAISYPDSLMIDAFGRFLSKDLKKEFAKRGPILE
ncbi:MAG: tRNA (adenosine(37)-N6)-threonylcarbamoyltransferase complex transferase subunit TsaD [Halobacteriovorax sp.]|nr:tRNA (adenosine(37)-N6)-threonylcarbamoyltransferase complex transferase subunit TsaD [Halobacteriovorax sp.]|tara:strand:+ start:67014 stop:68099 length:1086 start_codon:yes stop_codon:yes gene_type:complete